MKTFKLSPSTLNLMKDCERCFWLTLNGIWQRPEMAFPSLPSGMDRILKIYFDKYARQGKLPPELDRNPDFENVKLFSDFEKLDLWRNSLKGLSYQDEEGNILQGAVDNIAIQDEKLIVLDYKTRGFPLKENSHEHYEDQLNIYTYLLNKNEYQTKDFAFLLFYIPNQVIENGVILFDSISKRLKVYPEKAEQLFEKAINLLNSPCPKHVCKFCIDIRQP